MQNQKHEPQTLAVTQLLWTYAFITRERYIGIIQCRITISYMYKMKRTAIQTTPTNQESDSHKQHIEKENIH